MPLFALVPICLAPRGVPSILPSAIVWRGRPAHRMLLDTWSLGTDPDGKARWVVRVRFMDAGNHLTKLLRSGDVEFRSSRGDVQWQTRMRYGGPAAIVSTTESGPVAVRVISKDPVGIDDVRVETDTRAWHAAPVVVRALGPHMVQIGWFPAAKTRVEVTRSGLDGDRVVCTLSPPSSTCRDANVAPRTSYRYTLTKAGVSSVSLSVSVPSEIAPQSLNAFRGKGMWLRFSPDLLDDDAYSRLDATAIVERAREAGLRYIEIRMAYGEFWEVTAAARAHVEALIDAAGKAGLAPIAWTVPRSSSFADLSLAVAAANYRTAHGTRVAGLAVDFERGDEYMGNGLQSRTALAAYSRHLRQALGPAYLIVGTVEDPYLNGLTNKDFPFSVIAENSNALQPMMYWRFFQKGIGTVAVRSAVRQSMKATRREAGRQIPINLGGQTSGIGACGAPPSGEIVGSLEESRQEGAMGETFFDWFGTLDAQWAAIASFPW